MSNINDRGFFDEHFRLEKLSAKEDPLAKLDSVIEWEAFRPILEGVFPKSDPSLGGRPPFDKVMLFKILIIQSHYNISDDDLEFQILDRLTFMRFCGLKLSDRVPDAKTIWLFREHLKEHRVFDTLFNFYRGELVKAGLYVEQGQIIDANIVEVPKQRNTREENAELKQGKTPKEWKEDTNKLRQKDIDADWLKKNGKNYYGYKNHVKVDSGSKLIKECQITPASVHDSEVMEELLEESDHGQELYADSAYTGPSCSSAIKANAMENQVCEKGYRNKPLTKKQKKSNTKKSKIRSRVEHVFGYMTMNMNLKRGQRYIGIDRNTVAILMRNLVYNMCRTYVLLA